MEINYMLAYGSAEASLRLLWRFGLMEILLPIQASYLVSQGFRRRDGRFNMLLSLFCNLDRLVAPDRPCNEFLWMGILAFHKALVDQPRDPIVVMTLAESIKSAARKMNNREYLANAMSKYPQAPESDMVFMSKPLVERVQKMFGSVRRKGIEEREEANVERNINNKSLAIGDFQETRRIFARVVFDTVYRPT